MKKLAVATLMLLVPALVLAAWAGAEEEKTAAKQHVIKALAVLQAKSGSKVKGVIHFVQKGHTVEVSGEIAGLKPGKHAFHVHEFGDCSDDKAMNSGSHFNPTKMQHGAPEGDERHVGDLGNIVADAEGNAKIRIMDRIISLTGNASIIGRAVIVHADPDDFSQPVGNAGGRVACGVIGYTK